LGWFAICNERLTPVSTPRRPAARDLINLYIRHARHYKAGLRLMSQTSHEFVRTNERREVYETVT